MISHYELFLRLLLAVILGGAVGLERELRHKTAGFRTAVLICLGAAVMTIVSIRIAGTSGSADPGRIAAQVVTGVGFLGAGAIIQSRGSVIGLTTAASIWVTAGIGIAVGAGYYLAGILTSILTVVILFFKIFEVIPFWKKRVTVQYYCRYKKNPSIDELVRNFIESSSHLLEDVTFDVQGNAITIRFSVNHFEREHAKFQQTLQSLEQPVDVIYF